MPKCQCAYAFNIRCIPDRRSAIQCCLLKLHLWSKHAGTLAFPFFLFETHRTANTRHTEKAWIIENQALIWKIRLSICHLSHGWPLTLWSLTVFCLAATLKWSNGCLFTKYGPSFLAIWYIAVLILPFAEIVGTPFINFMCCLCSAAFSSSFWDF